MTKAGRKKSGSVHPRTPRLVVDFEKAPRVGKRLGAKANPHVLIHSEPYVRKDGAQSRLLTWRSRCEVCDRDFEIKSGLKGTNLSKRCEGHRTRRTVQRTRIQKHANGPVGRTPSSITRKSFDPACVECEAMEKEDCTCECEFDTDDVCELQEDQGDGEVYGSAYCTTHGKYCIGVFEGFIRHGVYQRYWSPED